MNVLHAAFYTDEGASRAVGALIDHGVEPEDISVIAQELPETWREHMERDADEKSTSEEIEDRSESGITITTGADAAAGAKKGAGVGLGVGVLAGIAALAVPGVGIVLGGTAVALAAAGAVGATAAGALAGGALGYLKDQGVDEETATVLHGRYQEGSIIVSVNTPSSDVSEGDISAVLNKYLAEDSEVAEERGVVRHPVETAPGVSATPPYRVYSNPRPQR